NAHGKPAIHRRDRAADHYENHHGAGRAGDAISEIGAAEHRRRGGEVARETAGGPLRVGEGKRHLRGTVTRSSWCGSSSILQGCTISEAIVRRRTRRTRASGSSGRMRTLSFSKGCSSLERERPSSGSCCASRTAMANKTMRILHATLLFVATTASAQTG